jgi:uncharacterized repeat protein (TIGR03803 family)
MVSPGQHRIWIFRSSLRAAASGLALATMFVLTIGASKAVQAQTYQVIHDFTGGVDGAEPTYGITIDSSGALYGTTFEGDSGTGTAYKLAYKSTGWTLTPLYVFTITSNGVIPYDTLVIGRDGKLYGTTGFGGINGPCVAYGHTGCGTVFSLQIPVTLCHTSYCPWTETPLYKFSGHSDGSTPYGATLVFDAAGNLYGTTFGGGGGSCTAGCGVVFKLTPSAGGWTESVLHTFTGGTDGASPWAGVTLDQAGNLYGTTSAGGVYGYGTVYELSPSGSGWTETTLHSFQRSTEGANPYSGLIFDHAGNLYGATQYGGSGGGGTVFELTPAGGGWTFATLYSFNGSGGGLAKGPVGNLVMDSAGNIYGSTAGDGAYRFGAVFKLTHGTGGWTYTSLHDFTNGLDGGSPRSNVVFDAAGNIYGTASAGGTGNPTNCVGNCGVIWQITPH